jgi:hypothetical protein
MKNAKTTKIGGGADYAKVPDRLKLFREECPNGLVETLPEIREDGSIVFSARILKDKARPESGEATGHAFGQNKTNKDFEKLETIAVGRALALLGYLASGEIASSEEMSEFYEYQQQKITEAIEYLNEADTIEDLKTRFMSLGSQMSIKAIIDAKDAKKASFGVKL